MIYSAAELAALWQAARLPAGIAVIGGGRWGKVWLQVIARARGDVRDVALVSRSHATDVIAWAAARTDMDGLRVVSTMSDAFAPYGLARIAIVATRPADHVRDALAALEEGAHVLVEKPLSHDAAEADRLVRAAQDRRLLLGIGTEFALLPAFHQGAAVLRERGHPPQRMELAWTDSNGEHRYGAAKARHPEIGILDDLLPHAVSIFSVFAPDATLTIESALESAERTRGHLRFRGPYGLVCEIACDSRPPCGDACWPFKRRTRAWRSISRAPVRSSPSIGVPAAPSPPSRRSTARCVSNSVRSSARRCTVRQTEQSSRLTSPGCARCISN